MSLSLVQCSRKPILKLTINIKVYKILYVQNTNKLNFFYSYDNSNRFLNTLNIDQGDNTYSVLNTNDKGGKITTTYSTSKPILKRLVRLSEDIQKIANSF